MYNYYKNQPFAESFEIGVLKVRNIHRKTPVLESLFSKVASVEAYKFIKKILQHRCFPVNIENFLRKFYIKNTTGGCFCTWNSRIWLYKSGNWWHILNTILCVSIIYFWLSLLLKLLQHVKPIIFENYNECKTKQKNSDMAEKDHRWREESITACPKEEDPISEDSKKTLSLRTLKNIFSMRNLKRALITAKPKDNAINGYPQELQDPQWLLRCKLTLFGFLVMLHDRVDNGDKFSKKNFGLGRLRFHATSHLKVSPVLAPGS